MVTKKTYRESMKLALAAALVSFVAVCVVLWEINGQMTAVVTQKAQLQKLTGDLSNLDTILSDEKTYAPVIERVSATLPKNYSTVATAIGAIELSAKTNNIPIDLAIDGKPKPETGDLKSLSIAIKTTGSYSDISQFTGSLAILPYHTHVDALTFDEAAGKITTAITIRLFMQ